MTHLGIAEVRLIGGEPLLRRGLPSIVARTAALCPRPEISLTTNAIGLALQPNNRPAARHRGRPAACLGHLAAVAGPSGPREGSEPDGEAVVGVPERDVEVELVCNPQPEPKPVV